MTLGRILLGGLAGLLAALVQATPAAAAETGRIVAVDRVGNHLRLVFQADGLPEGVSVDLATVNVRVNGETVAARAERLTSSDAVTRVTVLAIDNSHSMAGAGLAAAKDAATTFLSVLPEDVEVGLVTFADTATVVVEPTKDRGAVQARIDSLALDPQSGTALYDGAALAADATGAAGARSIVLLTDGNEDGSSGIALDDAVSRATDDDVAVDAVYIGPTEEQPRELQDLVTGAGGQVIASDTADLAGVFRDAAQAISDQVLIDVKLSIDAGDSGNVLVSVDAGTASLADSAFASFKDSNRVTPPAKAGPIPLHPRSAPIGDSALPVILGAVFVALLVALYVALSGFRGDERRGRVRRRLSDYSLIPRAVVARESGRTALGSSQVARSAVELAGLVVGRRDFERSLARRLESAGVPLKPAEWTLIHAGVAVGSALLLLLLSGGRLVPAVLGLVLGSVLPWIYLIVKDSRRTAAFLGQLPDTLQLIAGSLSAGYSVPQAIDTVVREGQQPITGEFNRALIESRLGVPVEDALDSMAERMRSRDFAWVVMAIRIQREVGGNLAELLTTVANTLRERERLRRQIEVLSAEGRLSAWILGLLPLVFALYLTLVRPEYLRPLVSEALGWLLLGLGGLLLVIGALWMRKSVKVEV